MKMRLKLPFILSSLAKKEMENEKIVNGTLIGPRSEVKTEKLVITDLINPSRPFMAKNVVIIWIVHM
jgi:hypothetical protein